MSLTKVALTKEDLPTAMQNVCCLILIASVQSSHTNCMSLTGTNEMTLYTILTGNSVYFTKILQRRGIAF